MPYVTVEVDGRPLELRSDRRLLWALLEAGVYVPHLCAVPESTLPFGGCRLCFVEVEGRGPTLACHAWPEAGMVIRTRGPRIDRLRRTALELILSAHEVDCAHCPKRGQCELQRIARFLKVSLRSRRFRPLRPELPPDESVGWFRYDPAKCVVCGRCVWACKRQWALGAIDFAFRGLKMRVSTFAGVPRAQSSCDACGQCVEVCPTAGLSPVGWERPAREVLTTCPRCSVGCGLHVGVREDRPVSVRAEEGGPGIGMLCVHGRFEYIHRYRTADRPAQPLLWEDDRERVLSWEEALELAADSVGRGRAALLASPYLTNEEGYVAQRFARTVMQTNDLAVSCDVLVPRFLWRRRGQVTAGPLAPREAARGILVVGQDPSESHPLIARHVRRAAWKGAKLVVIAARDRLPYADVRIRPEAGGEGAALRELLGALRGRPAGGPLREAARLLEGHRPLAVVFGPPFPGGEEDLEVLFELSEALGSLDHPAGGLIPLQPGNAHGLWEMGMDGLFLPGGCSLEERGRWEERWGHGVPEEPGRSWHQVLEGCRRGEYRTLWVLRPDELELGPLGGLELLVTVSWHRTPRWAPRQLLLPCSHLLEGAGTLTNLEGLPRPLRPVLPPQGRSLCWLLRQVAERRGVEGLRDDPEALASEVEGLVVRRA